MIHKTLSFRKRTCAKKTVLLVKLFFQTLGKFNQNASRKKRFMDTIELKGDNDAVKSGMVIDAVERGIRIKEVGIGIWGDGKISGGYD